MAQFEFELKIEGLDGIRKGNIPKGTLSIGRVKGNNLVLPNEQVSRQHAQLERTDTECYLTDLGSSNGTAVNGESVKPSVPHLLTHGDVIQIGPYSLTFSQVQAAAEAVPPSRESKEPAPQSQKPPAAEKAAGEGAPPPPPRPPRPPIDSDRQPQPDEFVPPGLSIFSRRLVSYLPAIYHPLDFDEAREARRQTPMSFMVRFLGIFESILSPIEWTADNFDLYLSPGTAPIDFLPWLATWFAITFEPTWNEAQRRTFLREAHWLYARRGTRSALSRVLEIHAGVTPVIEEPDAPDSAHTFIVRLPRKNRRDEAAIQRIIDASKPAHTMYKLEFTLEPA